MLERFPDHLFVYSTAVVPFRQESGLGTALLAFADELATVAGLPSRYAEVLVDMVKRMDGGPRGKRVPA